MHNDPDYLHWSRVGLVSLASQERLGAGLQVPD